MRVDLFDFDLPTDRIALRPARPRDAARMLLVEGGRIADRAVLDLAAEFNDLPHLRGVASMARADQPNTANSQFFLMLAPRFSLDHKYSAFGRVIEGMAAVDTMAVGEPPAAPTTIVRATIGGPLPAAPVIAAAPVAEVIAPVPVAEPVAAPMPDAPPVAAPTPAPAQPAPEALPPK